MFDKRWKEVGNRNVSSKKYTRLTAEMYDNAKIIGFQGKIGDVLGAFGWIYAVRKNPI